MVWQLWSRHADFEELERGGLRLLPTRRALGQSSVRLVETLLRPVTQVATLLVLPAWSASAAHTMALWTPTGCLTVRACVGCALQAERCGAQDFKVAAVPFVWANLPHG